MNFGETLKQIIEHQDRVRKSRPYSFLVSADMKEYMEASISGDKDKLSAISDKINASIKRTFDEDMARMASLLPSDEMAVFAPINTEYKQHGFTRTATSLGEKYFYWWALPGIKHKHSYGYEQDDEDTNHNVYLVFQKGVYNLCIHISYEGYGPGTIYLEKDILPANIHDKLQKVFLDGNIPFNELNT